MPRNPTNDQLRVSHLQRENAVLVLRNAAGDGRLTFDEVTERVAAALTAITRGDLVRLIGDLVPEEDLDRVIADPNVLGTGPGFRWDQPLVLRAGQDNARTLGVWDMPPFMELLVGADSIVLDCQLARPLNGLIDIAIVADGWGGSVTVVVPEGWGVDTQQIMTNSSSASVSSKVATRPSDDHPRLILRGRISGWLRVRHPSRWDERRRRNACAKLGATADRPALPPGQQAVGGA